MPRLLGTLLLLAILIGSVFAQEPKKEPELTKEEQARLKAEADRLNEEGFKLHQEGRLSEAETKSRKVLELQRQLYPPWKYPNGHSDLAISLDNLAFLLVEQGKLTPAEALYHEALRMKQKLYPSPRFPDGHPALISGLNNVALLLQAQGRISQAEVHFREILAMCQKLYPPERFPDGHPHIAVSLDNLAMMLQRQGMNTQAEPLARQALAMRQKLYPPERYPAGHQELAHSLHNLASIIRQQNKLTAAEPLYREALVMFQNLYPSTRYPAGHPSLATSMNSLSRVLADQGHYTQAEALCRDALAMRQKLYPPARYPAGHFDLIESMDKWAFLLHAQGKHAQAEPLCRDALTMHQRLTLAYAAIHSEGETLTLLTTFPATRDGYLSLLQQQSVTTVASYALLWSTRSTMTRLAEQKHLAVKATPELRKRWDVLMSLRRQRIHLLLAPPSRNVDARKERNRQLGEVERHIQLHELQLSEHLPELRTFAARDKSSPVDVQKALPIGTIFVDLLRYTYFEFDPVKPGQEGVKRTKRYVAFIVSKEQVQRMDLGPAEPLEAAVKQWREAITKKNSPSEANSPATLRRLLWEPLEKHFPPGTTTVYLCPDQQLCFLPWGALPGKKADTVLLEDYSLAIVPHGPYLLGQLLGSKKNENKKTDLLVLGGVKYDDAPVQATVAAERGPDDPKAGPVQAAKGSWPYLPGTATEATAIQKLAEKQKLTTQRLSDKDAGTERFKQELPQARIAHLATHGFFADPKFRSVFQLDEKQFAMRGQERVGAGALLPSLLSGLVFAGANRPETPGRGILTAEELFDLDLTGMELAVLSACETGLGEVGGGEGVFGLQRAFHVAGCQNVIASLWKVNDVATMVLMEEFYRNLWEKKLAKREALRQAQLAVYRNPEMVLKRAQEMGVRGIEEEAQPLPAAGAAPARRSPPAWWAAFLLSGLGA